MHKNNAFDLLRILLATLVLFSHAFLIGGYGKENFITFTKDQTFLGQIAVMGFFSLSGYLISSSFENNSSPVVFLWHRLLRILPGLWVCLLVTAFIISPLIYLINNRAVTGYPFAGSDSAVSYVINNCMLAVKQWNIGSVLALSNYKESLNGSLWTLFPEFQCYFLTLIVGLVGVFKKNQKTLIILWGLVYVFYVIKQVFNYQYGPTFITLSNSLPLYTCYLSGSLLFTYRDKLQFDFRETIFFSIILLLLFRFGGFMIAGPMLIPVLCISVFSRFKARFRYDISYGLYIYGFPVEQLLSRLIGQSINVYIFFLAAFIISCLLGLLSNMLVEKPILKFKNLLNRWVVRNIAEHSKL